METRKEEINCTKRKKSDEYAELKKEDMQKKWREDKCDRKGGKIDEEK